MKRIILILSVILCIGSVNAGESFKDNKKSGSKIRTESMKHGKKGKTLNRADKSVGNKSEEIGTSPEAIEGELICPDEQATQIVIVNPAKVKHEVIDMESKPEDTPARGIVHYENTARGIISLEKSEDADRVKAVKEVIVGKEPEPALEHESEQIFKVVEQLAQFPGGKKALMKFICDNLRYPEEAWQNEFQGRVIVTFVIEKDGSIGEVKILRSVEKSMDEEAIRIVKMMPRWEPAKMNGVTVRSWYTMPISFHPQYPKDQND